MIKIRYRDSFELAPGLHAAAERHGRSTIVYLLPGLSAAQRRAALRRLRFSARRGYGPQLPALQLAVALLAARVRTMVGQTGAVVRSHPAGSTVPIMVVSAGAIAFLALSAVSIRVIHPPRGFSPPSFARAAGGLAPNAGSGSGGPPRFAGGQMDPGQPDRGQAGSDGQLAGRPGSRSRPGAAAPGRLAAANAAGASGVSSGAASPGSGPGSGGGTTQPGSSDLTPAPAAEPSSVLGEAVSPSSAAPAPAASAPGGAPGGSTGVTCLDLGSLGVCL
jgi:hypothetical protein